MNVPKGSRRRGLEGEADERADEADRLRQNVFLGLQQEVGRRHRQDDIAS
jgi:hypothetical protein